MCPQGRCCVVLAFLSLGGSHVAPRLSSEIPDPPISGPDHLPLPSCWGLHFSSPRVASLES